MHEEPHRGLKVPVRLDDLYFVSERLIVTRNIFVVLELVERAMNFDHQFQPRPRICCANIVDLCMSQELASSNIMQGMQT